jgi:hypothetical protein
MHGEEQSFGSGSRQSCRLYPELGPRMEDETKTSVLAKGSLILEHLGLNWNHTGSYLSTQSRSGSLLMDSPVNSSCNHGDSYLSLRGSNQSHRMSCLTLELWTLMFRPSRLTWSFFMLFLDQRSSLWSLGGSFWALVQGSPRGL